MPPETDNQLLASRLRELAAALWAEVEQITDRIRELEEAADQLAATDDASRRAQVACAMAIHSLNCIIKLSWAAKALAMYCEALEASEE
jgi:hypothetical protein